MIIYMNWPVLTISLQLVPVVQELLAGISTVHKYIKKYLYIYISCIMCIYIVYIYMISIFYMYMMYIYIHDIYMIYMYINI